MSKVGKIWDTLSTKPMGKKLFSLMVCKKAPYFGTIKPTFQELRPGRCVVTMKNRRAIQNHLGTVHAIAMCNMAELAGGTLTDVSIPKTHRWIPVGMTVEYLKKAKTDLKAEAKIPENHDFNSTNDLKVPVKVMDNQGIEVFRAEITMRVSPKKNNG